MLYSSRSGDVGPGKYGQVVSSGKKTWGGGGRILLSSTGRSWGGGISFLYANNVI